MSVTFNNLSDWLGNLPPMLPSFEGTKVWETVVFDQYADQIDWYNDGDSKSIIVCNSNRKFAILESVTGLVNFKIEPNFHQIWNDDTKEFNDPLKANESLIRSNPIVLKSYWHCIQNGYIHSIFDPSAKYTDYRGNFRLRKTVYFASIASKHNILLAFLNKGENKSLIEIYSMDDHSLIQIIETNANGNHACDFINNNAQIIVGSDEGLIRIFDTLSGELIHQLEGHEDSVLCMDVLFDESQLITASADGIWKTWNLIPGEDFGKCIHTSDLLNAKYDRKIPIYRVQYSPDGVFIFITTDIGRLMIFHRENILLQTNIYDRYQSRRPNSDGPALISLLIDSDEKCFYVGYANGRIQKWK